MMNTKKPEMSAELTTPLKLITVLGGGSIYNADRDYVMRFARTLSDAEIAMYRRIVACVNACAGIPTEKLESEATDLRAWLEQKRIDAIDMAERNLDMKQQRDKLLAALIEIQQVACSGSPELHIATDAIAELESTK